jgi:CBS domain-containing protein
MKNLLLISCFHGREELNELFIEYLLDLRDELYKYDIKLECDIAWDLYDNWSGDFIIKIVKWKHRLGGVINIHDIRNNPIGARWEAVSVNSNSHNYVLQLGSDDFMDPKDVAAMINLMDEKQANIVYPTELYIKDIWTKDEILVTNTARKFDIIRTMKRAKISKFNDIRFGSGRLINPEVMAECRLRFGSFWDTTKNKGLDTSTMLRMDALGYEDAYREPVLHDCRMMCLKTQTAITGSKEILRVFPDWRYDIGRDGPVHIWDDWQIPALNGDINEAIKQIRAKTDLPF